MEILLAIRSGIMRGKAGMLKAQMLWSAGIQHIFRRLAQLFKPTPKPVAFSAIRTGEYVSPEVLRHHNLTALGNRVLVDFRSPVFKAEKKQKLVPEIEHFFWIKRIAMYLQPFYWLQRVPVLKRAPGITKIAKEFTIN